MTLTSVVLPAPLGPMRPWMVPCSTSSDTPSTACTPPKCRWTSSRRRSTDSGARPPRGPDDRETTPADDALRAEDDDGDQKDTGDDVDVVTGAFEDVRQERDDERADDGPQHESAAAEDREGEHLDRARDAVLRVTRIDEEIQMGLERPGVRRDERAHDERDHLVA